MSSGMQRRGRPVSRNSSSASSSATNQSSNTATSSRIGRRGGQNGASQKPLVRLPSEPDPERDIYVVEALIKAREPAGPGEERHFFVKWLNYPSSQNSWEPESNLSRDLVVQWDRQHPPATHPPRQSNGVVISVSSSSERSLSRADSKMSVQSSEAELGAAVAASSTSKGKKRVLPVSPKMQTVAPPKTREKTPPPPAEKPAVPDKSAKKPTTTATGNNGGISAASRSKLLEVVGQVKPERILAVYREAEGELCYLIERSCTISSPTKNNGNGENSVPLEPPPLPLPTGQGLSDRLQIVSSQVFDTLWPNDALDFYERQVQSTICLESLDSVPLSTSRRNGNNNNNNSNGDGLASAMANAFLDSSRSSGGGDKGDDDDDEEEEDEFEVERVCDVMYRGSKRFYFLKWVGYSEAENTWEPEDSLSCPHLLDAFWASRPEADPRKKKKLAASTAASASTKNPIFPVVRRPQKILGFYLEGTKSPVEPDNLRSSMDRWRLMVKWQGDAIPEAVPYSEARNKWPMTVLKFFQKYLDG